MCHQSEECLARRALKIYDYLCSDIRWKDNISNTDLVEFLKNRLLKTIRESTQPYIQEKLVRHASLLGYEVPCKVKTQEGLYCTNINKKEGYCTFHFDNKVKVNDILSSRSLNIPPCLTNIITEYYM